jgi:hypothetical protein
MASLGRPSAACAASRCLTTFDMGLQANSVMPNIPNEFIFTFEKSCVITQLQIAFHMDTPRSMAKHVINLPKSGSRDFFEIGAQMKAAISRGGGFQKPVAAHCHLH